MVNGLLYIYNALLFCFYNRLLFIYQTLNMLFCSFACSYFIFSRSLLIIIVSNRLIIIITQSIPEFFLYNSKFTINTYHFFIEFYNNSISLLYNTINNT